MSATPTGTPTAITWASGANPAGQSIPIPSDATAVYMFWTFWNSGNGHGLASVTLAGNAPNQTFELATTNDAETATGVAAWYNPATGSQTLDPAWDASPAEGPTTIVAYVKDGDTTAWRDADADAAQSSNAVTVTLTTASGDLVLKYNQGFDTLPGTSAGWTSAQTTTEQNGEDAQLTYIAAAGSTQVCDGENENYSSVLAIAIPAAAAGSASLPPPRRNSMRRHLAR